MPRLKPSCSTVCTCLVFLWHQKYAKVSESHLCQQHRNSTTTTTTRTLCQQKEIVLHRPGIEPGASRVDLCRWQRLILPLNHRCDDLNQGDLIDGVMANYSQYVLTFAYGIQSTRVRSTIEEVLQDDGADENFGGMWDRMKWLSWCALVRHSRTRLSAEAR